MYINTFELSYFTRTVRKHFIEKIEEIEEIEVEVEVTQNSWAKKRGGSKI